MAERRDRPQHRSEPYGSNVDGDKQRQSLLLSGPRRDLQQQPHAPKEKETDPHRLDQRQRQIDFGKNTKGYEEYVKQVPRNRRAAGHPRTPDKFRKCSKRAWDGLVKKWRRELHRYDPGGEKDFDSNNEKNDRNDEKNGDDEEEEDGEERKKSGEDFEIDPFAQVAGLDDDSEDEEEEKATTSSQQQQSASSSQAKSQLSVFDQFEGR